MQKSAIAKLADNLNDIPLLFPPLKRIAFELLAEISGLLYMLLQAWKQL
jgi:hypothetical protein